MRLVRAVAAVLLLLTTVVVYQSAAAVAAELTPRLTLASNIAFLPRGGARKGKLTNVKEPVTVESETDDVEEVQSEQDEKISSDEAGTIEISPFQKAYQEEVSEIKKSQEFLQMQQRRRELDKTWLDKGITAVIELFENIFRWEVID